MKIIKHNGPKLKLPSFKCDTELCKHLNNYPLMKHINKRFIVSLISRPGGGKTSFLVGLLQTKNKEGGLKKVFNKIYVFMPESSRESLKNNIFDELADDQKFEGINSTNINYVYQELLENKKNGLKSLIIFDDVQHYLKMPEVEPMILHLISNSRHLSTSMFFLIQSYNKVSQNVRKNYTDLFLFDVSKQDLNVIYDQIIEIKKTDWEKILLEFNKEKQKNPHSFLYINIKESKFFINWNEVIIDE